MALPVPYHTAAIRDDNKSTSSKISETQKMSEHELIDRTLQIRLKDPPTCFFAYCRRKSISSDQKHSLVLKSQLRDVRLQFAEERYEYRIVSPRGRNQDKL